MNNRYLAVAIIFFIVMVASAAWGYTLYEEPTRERKESVDYAFTYGGNYSLYAEVINENPIYPIGTVLTDMAGYFYSISPEVEVEFRFDFEPTIDGASVEVGAVTVLRLQSLDDNEKPFWTREFELSNSSATLEGTSYYTDRFTIDAKQIGEIDEEISEIVGGASGRAVGYLVTTATMNGSISSTNIGENETYSLPIYFRSDYYFADPEGATTGMKTKSYYTIIDVETQRGIRDLWLQIALASLGLIGFVASLWTGRSKGRYDYSEFADWISIGTFPGGDWEKEVYIPTLKDLVDVAIDTGKRVIYDKEDKIFFVIDGNILYFLLIGEEA
ncbi:MAG: hypothetical protein JW825_01330 [Candidatus Methanofastidiosa archaeon]|nr:hypothetical protein [Candidatus Methanofastidiosa archaeon]